MSYQEKRTVTSILVGVLVMGAYCVYAFGKYRSGAAGLDDPRFWGVTMLVFIGVGVVSAIIVQIVFHILFSISIAVKERNGDQERIGKAVEAAVVEDEMDQLIELKAMRVGFAICGAGFIGALVSLVFHCPIGIMLNILFLSFSVGSLAEGALSLYYYRAGVRNA